MFGWNKIIDSRRLSKKSLLGGVLLTVGLGWLLLTTGLGDGLVRKSYDLPFAWRPFIHPTEVAMVYLDDASHQQLHQNYLQPWPRSYYTKLLKRLTAENAKAVVFDIIFSDALDPKIDKEFAEAIQENGNVVLAAEEVLETQALNNEKTIGFQGPNILFSESAADLGSSATFPDEDLRIRRYVPIGEDGQGKALPYVSEAWAALYDRNVWKEKGKPPIAPIWLNYYGPASVIPNVSLYQALADNDPSVPRGFFSNKVVFIGARFATKSPADRKDEYPSPFSFKKEDRFMPGVAIHATACLNLLRGDWLRRLPYSDERVMIVILGILFGGGFIFCRPIPAIFLALVSAISIAGINYYFFAFHNHWFPWLIAVIGQIPIALIWSISFHPNRR